MYVYVGISGEGLVFCFVKVEESFKSKVSYRGEEADTVGD